MSKEESIRKNIKQLKEESNLILQRKELTPEVKFFIKSMLSLMDIIVTVLLEKTIRKNSSNSGLPPSGDFGLHNDRNKKNRNEQKKRGSQLDNSRIEENTQILSPHKCSGCGVHLKNAKVIDTEERKLIDIEYVIKETTFIAETKKCIKCRKNTKVKFSEGVDGPEQYGVGIKAAIHMVGKSKDGILSKKQYAKLQGLYREILEYGIKQLPPFPESTGKRGRLKHTDAQNLWIRLKKHEDSVLMFAKVAEVDPTNNRAERDLRMSKVKKKVSRCFRFREYAAHFCRISSYVKTMRNKGYSSLQAITMALKGEIPA